MLCKFFYLQLLHRQRDAVALTVYFYHTHLYMLVQLHHLSRVGHITIGQLRHVYQSVLMHAYVDKGAKVGNVGHNAWQHHARNKVVDRGYVLIKLKLLYLFAGVAPWLLQNCLPKNANG